MVHLAFQPLRYSGPAIVIEVFREVPARVFIGAFCNLAFGIAPYLSHLPTLIIVCRTKVDLERPTSRGVFFLYAPL